MYVYLIKTHVFEYRLNGAGELDRVVGLVNFFT